MLQRKTIASILSYVLSPTVCAFYVIFVLFLYPPLSSNELNSALIFILAFLFLCIFPIIAILYYYKKGTTDIWVSNQHQRLPFYLVAITGYIIASIIFYLLNETTLFVLSVAYIGVTATVSIGNQYTKISSHSAGVAGPLAALSFLYGIITLPLFFFLPVVFWARLQLNAHTKTQLTLGTIIGLIVTYIVFFIFFPNPTTFI